MLLNYIFIIAYWCEKGIKKIIMRKVLKEFHGKKSKKNLLQRLKKIPNEN